MIGPGDSSLIAIAVKIIIGDVMTMAIMEMTISDNVLMKPLNASSKGT